MNTNPQSVLAKGEPIVTMSMKIRRAGSDEWVDGPEIHTAAALPLLTRVKLRVYKRLLNGFDKIQSKLEEHK